MPIRFATVNDTGRRRLKQFLADFHPLGLAAARESTLDDMAQEAESAFQDTGQAVVTLKPWDCTLGCAKELVLDEEDLDLDD